MSNDKWRTRRSSLRATSQEPGARRFAGRGLASIIAIKPIAHSCRFLLGDDSEVGHSNITYYSKPQTL
eukprot:COSAG05_NODE_12652_length_459_cov_2.530556_1_plen_67_part_10